MWPLPLERTPSLGCQAGPSPPAPPFASTWSVAPGAKIGSSAADARPQPSRIRERESRYMAVSRVALFRNGGPTPLGIGGQAPTGYPASVGLEDSTHPTGWGRG